MTSTRSGGNRKQVFINMFSENDYDDISKNIDNIMNEAERTRGQILEPTHDEKKQVLAIVKDFIKTKNRIIYGGYADHMLIKNKDGKGIYGENKFADIEFYSPTPVEDLIQLCDLISDRGFAYVLGREAQHNETYSLEANFNTYCDISYVPTNIYHCIQTEEIDGMRYCHPYFRYIDYLRMCNDPLGSYWRMTEKNFFDRFYKLQSFYPLQLVSPSFNKWRSSPESLNIANLIEKEYWKMEDNQTSLVGIGIDIYNCYIDIAGGDRRKEVKDISERPFMEFISISYKHDVINIMKFIQSKASDPNKITHAEFYPFFQFLGTHTVIYYDGLPVVAIYDNNNKCVPFNTTSAGYKICTFSYLVMIFLIFKFRSYVQWMQLLSKSKKNPSDKKLSADADYQRQIYYNYSVYISNLVKTRNSYFSKNNITAYSPSPFQDFKIKCIGKTIEQFRESRLRILERKNKGKILVYRYSPAEDKGKEKPKYFFSNSSGNIISNPKYKNFNDFNESSSDEIVDYTISDAENSDNEAETINPEIVKIAEPETSA